MILSMLAALTIYDATSALRAIALLAHSASSKSVEKVQLYLKIC